MESTYDLGTFAPSYSRLRHLHHLYMLSVISSNQRQLREGQRHPSPKSVSRYVGHVDRQRQMVRVLWISASHKQKLVTDSKRHSWIAG